MSLDLKQKPIIRDTPLDGSKWTNLTFWRNGQSVCWLPRTFETEKQAKKMADQLEKFGPLLPTPHRIILPNGTYAEWGDYSHTVQIPWKEK